MTYTFQESKDEVARIVKYFSTNRPAFLAAAYKEAHARQELIDPLFAALNWDVSNRQHAAPEYREVVVEDSLDIEGQKKAPDYAFRIGKDRKFFGEAKKPGVDLKKTTGPAYQLRRYAWSAKLPLSILTDFEEFSVYDCRTRPNETDKASVARVNYLTFQQYPDRWQEIWDIFSRDAVWSGSFDQYALEGQGRKGKSEVDTEFLREIEGWRLSLAQNIALRNPKLTVDELTDSVQRIIDRIIFLRMAEDRGVEEYGRLGRIGQSAHIYKGLLSAWQDADVKYNSGLFDFSHSGDQVTQRLAVDDKALKAILTDLYFPKSPYEFSVMPAQVLGNVYEQFLGKVIRLTSSHQAKVEEKPEVKKAGGVFYTPSYIVDYVVKETIGEAIRGKAPNDLKEFRVLDPSCGSGSFLLGAYSFLLEFYREWYVANEPQKHKNAVTQYDGGWQLTLQERKRILTQHIFGVDLDRQAVEVTKLSLSLKVLEGIHQLTLFSERALPHLDANIRCGNSLVEPDFFDGQLVIDNEELRKINPFDWNSEFPVAMAKGGFDCIVGNPPYIRMEAFKELKAYFKKKYASHDERSDIYAYFIEKSQSLMAPSGTFGMIVSNKFLRANYGKPLRDILKETVAVKRIVDLAGLPVFIGATVRTIILITTRSKNVRKPIRYSPPLSSDTFAAVAGGSLQLSAAVGDIEYEVGSDALSRSVWSFGRVEAEDLLARLQSENQSLITYCSGQICMGVKSGLTEAFVIDEDTKQNLLKRNPEAGEIIKPFLNGRDVRRYQIETKSQYLIYTYHGVDIRRYPAVEEHLKPFKVKLQNRATKQAWYELQQPQRNFAKYMEGTKIIFPDIATTPRFSLDTAGHYCTNTTYFIPRDDLYLLGLLNSRLGYFYFVMTCAGLEGKNETYLRFFGQYLEGFPVHPADTNPEFQAKQDQLKKLVQQMLHWQDQKAGKVGSSEGQKLQRLIDTNDRAINTLVYEIYRLNKQDISVIEDITK